MGVIQIAAGLMCGQLLLGCGSAAIQGSDSGSEAGLTNDAGGNPDSGPPPHSRGPALVLAMVTDAPKDIAVDATDIYWISFGDLMTGSPSVHGRVVMVSKDGGSPTTIASDVREGVAVAVDTNTLYWATNQGTPGSSTVMKANKDGTDAIEIKPGGATSIAIDGTTLHICDGRSGLLPLAPGAFECMGRLAVDSMFVYAGKMDAGDPAYPGVGSQVLKVPKTGGPPMVVTTFTNSYPASLVVDSSSLYVLTQHDNVSASTTDGKIVKIPLQGGAMSTLTTFLAQPLALAQDSDNLYYTTRGTDRRNGDVWALSKMGGAPRLVAQNLDYPGDLAASEGDLYVAVEGRATSRGSIQRFPKNP